MLFQVVFWHNKKTASIAQKRTAANGGLLAHFRLKAPQQVNLAMCLP